MKEIMLDNFVACMGRLFIINFAGIGVYQMIKHLCKMNFCDDGKDKIYLKICSIVFWIWQITVSGEIIRLYFFKA
jgi:hypothetical protein